MSRVHYGFVITRDHLDERGMCVHGPANSSLTSEEIIAHGKPFRMLDDDRNLVYSGMYCGPDDETLFSPLDDFGMPDAGCTVIQYHDTTKPGTTWADL